VTQTGSTTVSHDANGNASAIGSAGYTYTSENRLATAPGVYLPYWASGMLWEIYESPSGTETMFEYVGGNMISEYDNTRTLTRRYVRGPGVDEPLVEYHGAGTSTRRFLHADERGSIVAITSDSGGILAINSYDEYGVPAAGNTGRFQYTGQPWIAQMGMYYYRARFYNPRLGRFMQPDPIGFGGGMNLYAYVGGDPINLTDPSGLANECVVKTKGRRARKGCVPGLPGPAPGPSPGPGFELWQNKWSDGTFSYDWRPTLGMLMLATLNRPGGLGPGVGGSGTGGSGDSKAMTDQERLLCEGTAYVLAGNPRTVGRVGGFLTPVRAGSAAIIPRQFTNVLPAGPQMRRIGAGAFGFTQGGQMFFGFTDTVGHSALGSAEQAQNIIMARHPEQLILELITGHAEDNSAVILSLPAGTPRCPSGTQPLGR